MKLSEKMKKVSRLSLLILTIALFLTILMIPMIQYPKVVYGSKVVNSGIMIDWIKSWWQSFVRHIFGQYGPAETAAPNQTIAKTYHLGSNTTAQTNSIITDLRTNKAEYSAMFLSYLQENGLANRKGQLDVFVTPDNIYLTFVWTGTTYELSDGWKGDQNCPVYLTATVTSSLLKDLYDNIGSPETLRSLVLQGQADGTLDYSVHRLTVTTSATGVMGFDTVDLMQIGSSLAAICGWCILVAINVRKK